MANELRAAYVLVALCVGAERERLQKELDSAGIAWREALEQWRTAYKAGKIDATREPLTFMLQLQNFATLKNMLSPGLNVGCAYFDALWEAWVQKGKPKL